MRFVADPSTVYPLTANVHLRRQIMLTCVYIINFLHILDIHNNLMQTKNIVESWNIVSCYCIATVVVVVVVVDGVAADAVRTGQWICVYQLTFYNTIRCICAFMLADSQKWLSTQRCDRKKKENEYKEALTLWHYKHDILFGCILCVCLC